MRGDGGAGPTGERGTAPTGIPGGSDGAGDDPVFVLCAGRSGSTLLRFLLDAHPDLACPPETRLPWLARQLATAWAVIEDAGPSGQPANGSSADAAISAPVADGAAAQPRPDDDVLPAAPGEAAVLRQEPGGGAARGAAAEDLARRPVHLPVPASDGCHRVRHRGVTVGPDQLRVRAVHRQPAGQQRGRAGQVLARLHDVDRRGRGALHRPLPPGQVRGPGHRPGRRDRADPRVHRRGAGPGDRGALLRPRAPAVRPRRLQDLEHQRGQRRLGRPGLDDAGRKDTRAAARPRQRAGRRARLHPGRRAVGDRGEAGRPADAGRTTRPRRRGRPMAGGAPRAGRAPIASPVASRDRATRGAAGLGGRRRRPGPGGAGAGRRAVRAGPRLPRERNRSCSSSTRPPGPTRTPGGGWTWRRARSRRAWARPGRTPTGRSPVRPRRGTGCWPARPTWASPSAGATCATRTRATPGRGRWAPTRGSPP